MIVNLPELSRTSPSFHNVKYCACGVDVDRHSGDWRRVGAALRKRG